LVEKRAFNLVTCSVATDKYVQFGIKLLTKLFNVVI
jgi:hypothetical protein